MNRILVLSVILFSISFLSDGQSWEETVHSKKATLDLFWNTSAPFIFYDSKGELSGVEYENILLFKKFLRHKYSIDLTLNWIEIKSFNTVLDTIKNSKIQSQFGVSAFSITPERKQILKFTNSYLSDIVVFVSSKGSPIVTTPAEIDGLITGKTAICIKATIYEDLLYDLRNRLDINFDIKFIGSDESVIGYIGSHRDCFGFIDLPIYLNLVRNGDGNSVTRQNLFTDQGTGYGYIMPLNSNWKIPFDEFLTDQQYKRELANIISKYFGKEYLDFIGKLYSGGELGTTILTEEKELQLALIENANLKLDKEETIRKLLTSGVIVTTLLLLIIGILFFNNAKNTKLLILKKNQIERQQESIRKQNEQLTIQNEQLVSLNEEKNNLVRILAHDMRAPLGQIIGSVNLLNDPPPELESNQKQMLMEAVERNAKKADEMIRRILDIDVLENNKKLAAVGEVDINQILADASQRYNPIAIKKGIRLETYLATENCIITSDSLLIALIIENLISNAIKFSKTGTSIKVSAEVSNEDVLFKVADQGPGFTKDDKQLIFNRFQRLSAKPTGGEHSIGLGLSIVKKYVLDLGGEASLESEEGKGSTFFIRIPNQSPMMERAS
ncbi:ATP-binding protein [Ekhidna sp.]|uniref:ATP-binding protein n=1 Tax=Ekhidna sp. TaxID=2608089 RepID=UPI0032971D6A